MGDTPMPTLQGLLSDLVSLSLQGKQLHWHVQGPNFLAVHRQLDDVVESARTYADDIAERSVTLGQPVDGTAEAVAKEHALTALPEGWVRDEDAVRLAADAVERVVVRGREVIAATEDEPVTQDLVIQVVAGLEKHLWMLRAQLAG
jgi:starvation-inducible DNA-binding protein